MRNGYRLLNACAIVCIVLTGAGRFLGIAGTSVVHILMAVIVIILCSAIQPLSGRGKLVCAVLAAVFFVAVMLAAGIQQCVVFLLSWFRWMAGSAGWEEKWILIYELLQVGIIALGCYAVQIVLEKFIAGKVILADILISLLLFCLLTEWKISHVGVVFSFAYIVMTYAEWIQREWKKTGSRDRKRYMMCLMPFVALYFFLMLLMPAPEHPYEWKFVRETCSRIRDSVMSLAQDFMDGGREDFDTVLSGFSEGGELREEIEEDDREVMILSGDRKPKTNVYLAGRIYDTFDGRSWLQENHDTEESVFQDALRLRNAVIQLESGHLGDYFSSETLFITYKHLRTGCLFTPPKTRQIRVRGENDPYLQDGDNLLFRGKMGYGTEYEVEYYQINAGSDRFDEFVRAACSTDTKEEETRRIYEIYTEDIELSEETERYLEAVAGKAYDRLDWLRLVEQELSSYTYTRQPESLPGDAADAGAFLDYFLLEGREGYCTHFATAFVLLARSQGMPARYVQGFCVPMKGVGEVSVYNTMAHAWPEVYFEGAGWIPFEPTPGYGGMRYTPWETEERDGAAENRRQEISHESAEPDETVRESMPGEPEEENGSSIRWLFRTAAYAVSAVGITGVLLLAIQRILRRRRYRRMDVTGRFRTVAAVNIRILAILGFRRDEKETLQEFREHIIRGEECEGCGLWFIEDYEKMLYGEKAVKPEMLRSAVMEREELIKLLKKKKKWRYFLYCYRISIP